MEKLFKKDQEIDFCREIICKSFEGRPVELITLTKKTKRLPELEKKYGDEKFLFPLGTKRPNRYDKPYIFYSCRVHAGEVGASYMLKGILEFIAEYKTNSDANAVLENYVILIIPMLNPDGVFRGH